MAGDVARQPDSAGPEQCGQGQEQIGLVVEPSDRSGRRRWRGRCHCFARSCAGFTPFDKSRACNATMSRPWRVQKETAVGVDLLDIEGLKELDHKGPIVM